MDGRGRAIDNIFIERLWRTVKYDEIYFKDYVSPIDAHAQLDTFFLFYNDLRPHRFHDGATPSEVYRQQDPAHTGWGRLGVIDSRVGHL